MTKKPSAPSLARARAIICFWLGDPDSPNFCTDRKAWFAKDDAFDAEIRAEFLADYEAACAGDTVDWRSTPETCLALIILLDQFPRNMFRGNARAHAMDPMALAAARHALAKGFDKGYPTNGRLFFYLPFEHSENPSDQDESVVLFETLSRERSVEAAYRHREIITRFGRFPHRNTALGRATTPEEAAFLLEPNSAF